MTRAAIIIAGKSPVRYVLDGAKIGRFRRSCLVWLKAHNKAKSRWWAQQDSNLRHADYELETGSFRYFHLL
jgi:hypothetical protein